MASVIVEYFGFKFEDIIQKLEFLKPEIGRLQRITNQSHQFHVFVDYAHTEDGLKKTLIELKKIKSKTAKLYVLFGCGGDRDKDKRVKMGKVASELADYMIVTDDNPRNEDQKNIRQEILIGAMCDDRVIEVAGREKAIALAIGCLKQEDILLIAGKGHENYQIIGNTRTHFNDTEIANQYLERSR